ncbi:MAG: hypothetical protein M1338_03540 [Patescibacteria group bacterium]|nr:hypothetical protein [Patescibacteria group bacterium]
MPYCCVPATLQWILHRHNLDILDQETIGAELGLCLPDKAKTIFQNKNIIFVDNDAKFPFGTQIEKKKYSINKFFKKYHVKLKISKLYYFLDINKLEKFIIKNLQDNNDIILRYHNEKCGHFSIIASYNDKTKKATVGDPEAPFFRQLTLTQILNSTSNKFDGIKRGLYVVN